ncbi:MAG: ECF transporter S component [Treponema sp.]|nr:ECF transporter S component [Treponema sp.]
MNNIVKKIAVAGVLSSSVIVLGTTGIGFILLPFGAAITILQVPVIIGAILEGPFVGLFIGVLFGIFSIVQSAIIAASPVDMAFMTYPFIALIPRMFIGPATWFSYALISGQLWNKKERKPPVIIISTAIIIAAIVGSLVNTVMVLGGLGLLKIFPWEVIFPIAALNGPVEAASSALITFTVVSLWKNLHLGRGRSKLSKEE